MIIVINPTAASAPNRIRLGQPNEPWTFASVGDVLLVRSAGPVIATTETVTAPAGDPPVIDDETPTAPTIEITEVGRHHFRVTTTENETADVHVIACEPGCLTRIPTMQASGGALVNKTRCLAEMARYSSFTGLESDLIGRNLANYGGA